MSVIADDSLTIADRIRKSAGAPHKVLTYLDDALRNPEFLADLPTDRPGCLPPREFLSHLISRRVIEYGDDERQRNAELVYEFWLYLDQLPNLAPKLTRLEKAYWPKVEALGLIYEPRYPDRDAYVEMLSKDESSAADRVIRSNRRSMIRDIAKVVCKYVFEGSGGNGRRTGDIIIRLHKFVSLLQLFGTCNEPHTERRERLQYALPLVDLDEPPTVGHLRELSKGEDGRPEWEKSTIYNYFNRIFGESNSDGLRSGGRTKYVEFYKNRPLKLDSFLKALSKCDSVGQLEQLVDDNFPADAAAAKGVVPELGIGACVSCGEFSSNLLQSPEGRWHCVECLNELHPEV